MITQIDPRDAAKQLAGPTPPHLLDVREPNEHAFASVAGAKLIPLGELDDRIEEIRSWQDEPVLVLCHHGLRSQHAISHLAAAGFSKLFNVRGGIDRWSETVDPSIPRY